MNQALPDTEGAAPHAEDAGTRYLYFGDPDTGVRFGCLHAGGDDARVGAVVLGTLGNESLAAHRSLRALACSLAGSGVPTLRFDYRATGDSGDAPSCGPSLESVLDDIVEAIAVLRTETGVTGVVVVGLRLGAAFALLASERIAVDGLVLWGPVTSGRRFVREWSMVCRRDGLPDSDDGADVRHAGFVPSPSFASALSSFDANAIRPLRTPPVLVVEREELPPEDALVERLTALGLDTERVRPGGFVDAFLKDPHLTTSPEAAIEAIRRFVSAHADAVSANAVSEARPVTIPAEQGVTFAHADRTLREFVLPIDPAGGPFGIVTEPVETDDRHGGTLLLVNSGSMHRIGPNGLYVDLARHLAARGVRVCRADLSGIGDGPLRPGAEPNHPYPAGAVDDVVRLIALLGEPDADAGIAVGGICSGAWAAFHTSLIAGGITRLVLINADFYGERSVVGKPESFVRPKDFAHYRQSARSLDKWGRLLTGRADMKKIARVLAMQARRTATRYRAELAGEQHALDRDLAVLADRGVRVGFVFTPGDGAREYLTAYGAKGRAVLEAAGLADEALIDDADHTFNPPASRRVLRETLAAWLGV